MTSSQFMMMTFLSVAVLIEGRAIDPLNFILSYGSQVIHISKVPWQVLVDVDILGYCGGVIISDRWVLTAAHCTFRTDPTEIYLHVGSSSRSEFESLHKVEQVVNHGGFNNKTYYNDISVLKTTSAIQFTPNVKPVRLPPLGSTRPPVGTWVLVSGWGKMEDDQLPILLRAVDIQIEDFRVCRRYFRYTNKETQICAGTMKKKICKGDSGGALVMGNLLVGITSFTDKYCKSPGDVFSDVAAFRGWIRKQAGI